MNNTVTSASAPATATGEEEEMKASKSFPGFIFLCNGRTKPECYRYRVFGLPSSKMDTVRKIKTGAKLFLFDFDSKLLYGVYEASSDGNVGWEPLAFGGKYPAQVQFRIYKGCLPLHEASFKHAIIDNYKGMKFKQELDEQQVRNLLSLFRPLSESSSCVPNPPANICSPLPNMVGPPKVILPFGEDPYATIIHQGHTQNIQVSQHGWQGSMPFTDRAHLATEHPGFAAPRDQYYTADSQRQVVTTSSYPYNTAIPNITATVLKYYTGDVQMQNIAAPSDPYHAANSQLNVKTSSYPYYPESFQQLDNTTSSYPYYAADSQQPTAAALSHQYYSTDTLQHNVVAPYHSSYTADSQQLNVTACAQQYCSTDSQQLNVAAASHPYYTADSQQQNVAAADHPYYTAASHQPYVPIDGAAQLRQETYFGSMQEAVPQDQLMGSQYEQQQLPQQMHHPSAVAYNSYPNPVPSAPYGSIPTQPEAPQVTNAPTSTHYSVVGATHVISS